jgi:hypothetical protein
MPLIGNHLRLQGAELQDAVLQPSGTAPSTPAASLGRIYTSNVTSWTRAITVLPATDNYTLTFAAQGRPRLFGTAWNDIAYLDDIQIAVNSIFAKGSTGIGMLPLTAPQMYVGHADQKPRAVNRDSVPLSDFAVPILPLNMGDLRVSNVATPTQATDAANKFYVDSFAQGMDYKASVRLATAAALPAHATTTSTLTASANGALTVDGIAVGLNDRILVKNETLGQQNGIYTVTAIGSVAAPWILTRASDADVDPEISAGTTVFAEVGASNSATSWVQTAQNITIGTTVQIWTLFGRAGAYTGGNGIDVSGLVISAKVAGLITFVGGNIVLSDGTGILGNQAAGGGAPAYYAPSTTGHVPRATGTAWAWAQLQIGDIGGTGAIGSTAAYSVLGRDGSTPGLPISITAAAGSPTKVLARHGSADLAWIDLTGANLSPTAGIVPGQISVAAYSFVGNNTAATAAATSIGAPATEQITAALGLNGTGTTKGISFRKHIFYGSFAANGSKLSWVFTHNMGTQDLIVQVRNGTTQEQVYPDVIMTTTNSFTLSFAPAPVAGVTYYVIAVGAEGLQPTPTTLLPYYVVGT